MKLLDLVKQMQQQGHKIKYYVRKDGGILIKSINGTTYTGAKGNTALRNYTGVKLSAKQEAQRQYNVKKYIKLDTAENPQKKRAKTLEQELKTKLRRVQAKWRKSGNSQSGQITARKVKYRLKTYGKQEALDYLNRMEQRAMGIAYDENVQHLAYEIEQKGKSPYAREFIEDFEQLAQQVLNKKPFYDKWIYPSYEALYNCKTKEQCQDTINTIKRICQL